MPPAALGAGVATPEGEGGPLEASEIVSVCNQLGVGGPLEAAELPAAVETSPLDFAAGLLVPAAHALMSPLAATAAALAAFFASLRCLASVRWLFGLSAAGLARLTRGSAAGSCCFCASAMARCRRVWTGIGAPKTSSKKRQR